MAASPDTTFNEAKPRLLPRVRHLAYFDAVRLKGRVRGREFSPPYQRLNADLGIELVIDLPEAIETVTPEQLAGWGKAFDELMPIARDNLWAMSNERWEVVRPGLYRSPWRDAHDASRIYLHDLVWQLEVTGEHVAFAPDRARSWSPAAATRRASA